MQLLLDKLLPPCSLTRSGVGVPLKQRVLCQRLLSFSYPLLKGFKVYPIPRILLWDGVKQFRKPNSRNEKSNNINLSIDPDIGN